MALIDMQDLLLNGQGEESAYPQHGFSGSTIRGRMTHLNWILLNDCIQTYLGHTSILHEVGVPWGFFSYSCDLPNSSSDSRDLQMAIFITYSALMLFHGALKSLYMS